ncbi:MAG: hypothetical protein JZU52_16045 [Lamprocystis purpurea]|jgi:zinc transporter|uniref:CorA family divalent cation transporter n=1 Tax=Lamprocystis purpurea TaxID=61598 RepID=UPI0003738771|nr:CorA family divalent cation transporter [Lamprocystis purpurea]MBV5275082.1 hypothetical protein [Lamprocystis purpurea]
MGVDLHDDGGLIFGFQLQSQGPAAALDLHALSALQPPEGCVWLHFNLNDRRAVEWVNACAWLSPESRDFLLSSEHNTRIEATGRTIAGVLSDVLADNPEEFGAFRFYADQTCLVTGRHHTISAVGLLHGDLDRGVRIETTAALLNRLLGHLLATFQKMVAKYGDLIDDAEDRVFSGRDYEMNFGQHRLAMARLRRQVSADGHALRDLPGHLPPWWDGLASKDLVRLGRALSSVTQDLELVQERARLLNEEIDRRLTERTNRNLYFVSVAATLFLPITLISSIFGMNVGGLPWLEDANGFVWVMGVMLASVIVAFVLIYWRRML